MRALDPWYLIRTQSNKEGYVRDRLSHAIPEVFLPMLELPRSRARASLAATVVPLFPQYVFARLDLSQHYFGIRYMPGVLEFVSAGCDPLLVPDSIIDGVRSQCTDNVVRFRPKPFRNGERVRIVEGLFQDFDAVFDTYLSGMKRVAILIQAIEGRALRVVTDSAMIARQ
jgi:transcriptional antiterminator RfaH